MKKEQDTTNSRVYKMAMLNYKRGCKICPPHRGCNRDRKSYWGRHSTWKKNRKNQYKE